MKSIAILGFLIFMVGLYLFTGKGRDLKFGLVAYIGLIITTMSVIVETRVYWNGMSPAFPAGIAFVVLVVGAKALIKR